jgi:murein DD-endopeptidase MepM/ murein hydrolase activator NlpD
MPMKFVLSAPFGGLSEVHKTPHTGIDIPMEVGTRLRSFMNGTVERVVDYGKESLGKAVMIRGEDGDVYIFGHLSKVTVKQGQTIHAGNEIIGLSGSSGHSTGPHLHFAIQHNGQFVDPTIFTKALEQVTGADPFGQFIGSQPVPGSIMDRLNHLGDKFIQKESGVIETVSNPVWAWTKGQLIDFGHWFVTNLPDLMGYGAIMAGVFIILGSMVGKGGMMKPLSIYAGALIVSFLVLAGRVTN